MQGEFHTDIYVTFVKNVPLTDSKHNGRSYSATNLR